MQGSISKRGSAWRVRVSLGYDPITKRRRWASATAPTKREAEALAAQLVHQRNTGIDSPPGRLTVADYLQKWLAEYAKPNTAPKTFLRYEQYVRLHLTPALGSLLLTKLRPLHIQAVYTAMQGAGLAALTALHCHRVLRTALQQAVRWQLITRNPADSVDPPRPVRYEIPALSVEAVQQVLVAAEGTRYGALVHTAVFTGLRCGELLGLRWQDVDLDGRVLHVRQVSQWLPGQGFTFRQPKTHRSARPVSLSPDTVRRLSQHRRSQLEERIAAAAYGDSDLVFADPRGNPVYPGTLRANWLRIVKAAGLGHLRIHDLRHAHASLMLLNGEHPKVVQERLGHSTIAVTMDTYSHVTPGMQADAAARLDRLLAGAGR